MQAVLAQILRGIRGYQPIRALGPRTSGKGHGWFDHTPSRAKSTECASVVPLRGLVFRRRNRKTDRSDALGLPVDAAFGARGAFPNGDTSVSDRGQGDSEPPAYIRVQTASILRGNAAAGPPGEASARFRAGTAAFPIGNVDVPARPGIVRATAKGANYLVLAAKQVKERSAAALLRAMTRR